MIYRKNAVDHLRLGAESNGTVLRATPRWVTWPFATLLILFVVLLAFALSSNRNVYVIGSGIVGVDNLEFVTAPCGGTVSTISVAPGDTLRPGQRLLATTGGDCQSRPVTAPIPGVALGVRVREGQELVPGEMLCAIAPLNCTYTLAMLLPGNSRPQLKVGAPGWFSAQGFDKSRVRLKLESVGSEAILWNELPERCKSIAGSNRDTNTRFLMATASLSRTSDQTDGMAFELYDGLFGTVRILTGTAPLIRLFSGAP